MTIIAIASVMLTLIANPLHIAEPDAWSDTYYQYRVPLTVKVDQDGWVRLPVDAARITEAVNALEAFKFDPLYFAVNDLRIVAVDEAGRPIDTNVEGGVYLAPDDRELASGALSVEGDLAKVRVTPHQFHLLRYTASGGGKCPLYKYEAIFPPDSPARRTDYRVSFFPPMLPLERTTHERLFVPDRPQLELMVAGRFVGEIHDVSVRRADIGICVKLNQPGTHRLMLYYQPMGSHHLQMPRKRLEQLPEREAQLIDIGPAQKFIGDTQYRIAENDALDVSHAASTVKITRHMSIPDARRDAVTVRAAANESQSFQLVLAPKRPVALIDITCSPLDGEHDTIAAEAINVRAVEYVPISQSSFITPARYIGDIGDPLIPVESQTLDPRDGRRALWVTVRVPPNTPAGTYRGSIHIRCEGDRSIRVPVRLEVFDFELPKYSNLHTDLGGQFFVKPMRRDEPIHTIMDYHGIEPTPENVRKLAHAYYDVMADNLFCPKSVALYDEIGLEWSPPPQGYNVDAPGNYFELHDWDFTQFNETLRHYIDERNINSICILHTNPTAANIFMHLPGERLEKPARSSPFVVTGWQSFRECTFVAYGDVIESYRDKVTMVTQAQWDNLVHQYFRRIAENLEEHGWLDKTHILIDETENPKQLEHLLSVLKSDPLTARIQVVACVQGMHLINEMSGADPTRRRFAGLLDTYAPEIDENYDRWMDYYFDDYNIPRDRDSLWFYAVTTSRLAIDAPGINNRMIGWDIFRRGGSGYLIWETFAWQHAYGEAENPWRNPYTRHANGSLAHFYPPKRDGVAETPDWSVTPSLRIETFREAVNDYDYAILLENLVVEAEQHDVKTDDARTVLNDVNRLFNGNTNWSQNDAWYLQLRLRMARAITALRRDIAGR